MVFLNSSESIAVLADVISKEMIIESADFNWLTSFSASATYSYSICFSVEREVLLIFEFGGAGVSPHKYNLLMPSASHKRNKLPTLSGSVMSLVMILNGNFLFDGLWSSCRS